MHTYTFAVPCKTFPHIFQTGKISFRGASEMMAKAKISQVNDKVRIKHNHQVILRRCMANHRHIRCLCNIYYTYVTTIPLHTFNCTIAHSQLYHCILSTAPLHTSSQTSRFARDYIALFCDIL